MFREERDNGNWIIGTIVGLTEGITNSVVFYFVRANQNHVGRDIRMHIFKLPVVDRFFRLENGTELEYTIHLRNDKPEVGRMNIFRRNYRKNTLLQVMENTIERCEREVELTPMLRSLHAWAFLGEKVRSVEDIRRFFKILKQLISKCKASRGLVKETLSAALNGPLLNHINGPIKEYMERLYTDEDKSNVLQLFVNITDLVPQHMGQVVRLLKVWSVDENEVNHFEHAMLQNMMKMLKNLSMNYLKQVGGGIEVDLLDYQELPLIPTREELVNFSNNPVQTGLLPVRTRVGYSSEEEYMETYTRLQRTDGFHTLCVGIQKFLKGELDHRELKVYNIVQFRGLTLSKSSRISLALEVQPLMKVKDLSISRHLMTGNLLCITVKGDFSDPVWPKVSVRHTETLKRENTILVELLTEHNQDSTFSIMRRLLGNDGKAMMAESPSFYTSFGPVLSALQKYEIKSLELKDIIVRCERDTTGPEYLIENRINLTRFVPSLIPTENPKYKRLQECSRIYIDEDGKETASVHDFLDILDTVPTLDSSQKQGIRHVLTNKVGIIQGPPGAGKSYLGTKLAEILLNLEKPSTRPIVVITYKNHALDEFLKGLLENGICSLDEMCRVGGGSKEPELESCNMFKVMGRGRAKDMEAANTHRDIMETNDLIGELCSELKVAVQEHGADLGLKLQDIVNCLDEEQLVRFLIHEENNQEKLKKNIETAIFDCQGGSLHDICNGKKYNNSVLTGLVLT
ncbi:NFX1-type zinc finger-containing protein 1 isoform X2 [Eurytemora carolleeae]|uniref:NFX1-type zinc finger-containing protein 1 isoform X2 n=1 Tax=Eurytemora carolleeae TaxID=1294199 RepID=UPI000C76B30A|nr:NFX1-type zinc finger-containing protein 1 isoform X2 [Eurytemora carolleeae]|eukprot:XP_023339488.1 NFX1-type zinc finger-containing protein 1-like isoform X2 [Eurytemora affinis]